MQRSSKFTAGGALFVLAAVADSRFWKLIGLMLDVLGLASVSDDLMVWHTWMQKVSPVIPIVILIVGICFIFWGLFQSDKKPVHSALHDGTEVETNKRPLPDNAIQMATDWLALSAEIREFTQHRQRLWEYSRHYEPYKEAFEKHLKIRLIEAADDASQFKLGSRSKLYFDEHNVYQVHRSAEELRLAARKLLREAGKNPEEYDPLR